MLLQDNIPFYSLDDNNNISCASDFGKFDYVKDFIDFIIQYRFLYNLKEISRDMPCELLFTRLYFSVK